VLLIHPGRGEGGGHAAFSHYLRCIPGRLPPIGEARNAYTPEQIYRAEKSERDSEGTETCSVKMQPQQMLRSTPPPAMPDAPAGMK